ncbi:hypothetical protein V1478_005586 [Vespula squamosa]|uniref:Uncharacterized protein n=1 Tax=Vespula squamosa TaxID=30214 RepID=A0ABD2BAH9_VESSQ
MLESCYNGQLFHERITCDKIIDKTNNITWDYSEIAQACEISKRQTGTFLKNTLSVNYTLTICISKPTKKVTILNSKHKRVLIKNKTAKKQNN